MGCAILTTDGLWFKVEVVFATGYVGGFGYFGGFDEAEGFDEA